MPDPLAPRHAFTKPDQQAAKDVDVRQDDVPAAYSPHGSQETGHSRCAPRLSDLTLTGQHRSPPFVTRAARSYVLGEVDVYRSRAQAAAAFRRTTAVPRRRCLLELGRSALSGFDDGRVGVTALSLPVTVPGRLTARRFAESWRENGARHAQTTDDVYLQLGRAFVILSFFRDRGRLDTAVEARVISRVAARAARAGLEAQG